MNFWNFVTDPWVLTLWMTPVGINLLWMAAAVLNKAIGPRMLKDMFDTDNIRDFAENPSSAWGPVLLGSGADRILCGSALPLEVCCH